MAKEFIMQMRPWFGDEEKQAVCNYMDEDGFITEFKNTKKFEDLIADYTGAEHCIVMNNGTISLTLAALASGVESGDEVIVPNYTMIATPNSVKMFGAKPGSGREKMFEVREVESDISFIRNYLTKDLVLREDMYLFQKQGRDYKIVDKEWEGVRDQLVSMRVNGGFPYITVNDGDYLKNNELYLKHWFEDIELDLKYLEKVLPYVYQLWGRPVHMESVLEGKAVLFSYDGKSVSRKYL